MSNKSMGNHFEREFCESLYDKGFWVHNLAQNASGQPADVIAARNGEAYLIDCKVCSTNKGFAISRIEDNQYLAMRVWEEKGNKSCYFAIKFEGEIYMIPFAELRAYYGSYYTPDKLRSSLTLNEWLKKVAS